MNAPVYFDVVSAANPPLSTVFSAISYAMVPSTVEFDRTYIVAALPPRIFILTASPPLYESSESFAPYIAFTFPPVMVILMLRLMALSSTPVIVYSDRSPVYRGVLPSACPS